MGKYRTGWAIDRAFWAGISFLCWRSSRSASGFWSRLITEHRQMHKSPHLTCSLLRAPEFCKDYIRQRDSACMWLHFYTEKVCGQDCVICNSVVVILALVCSSLFCVRTSLVWSPTYMRFSLSPVLTNINGLAGSTSKQVRRPLPITWAAYIRRPLWALISWWLTSFVRGLWSWLNRQASPIEIVSTQCLSVLNRELNELYRYPLFLNDIIENVRPAIPDYKSEVLPT